VIRLVRSLAVAAVLAAPLVASAAEAPHEDGLFCSNCHMGHNAPGVSLTNEAGNVNLCQSCHVNHPGRFGFPWADEHQAVPGTSGRSHRWDALATNLGATAPEGTAMAGAARLSDGKLQCSTCHDQHNADLREYDTDPPLDPAAVGTQHVSYAVGVAQPPTTGGLGRTLTVLSPVGAGAAPKGYLVEIVDPGSDSNATFKLSHDGGTSWFGCVSQNDYTYVAFSANPCKLGASVPLNDGTNVNVEFTGGAGTFLTGDRWSFYVSYPYLRVSNKDGAMCVSCHKDRHMFWQDVEGGVANSVGGGRLTSVSLGTTVFHHPVGQALRSPPSAGILDASGATQATGDGNATNDLRLGTGGVVTCTTCHHAHNADSNSLTEDPR
jgi:hypothetical protein